MAYNQQNGLVINKPIGIVDKAVDLRSQKYDNFVYRDYTSTAEVLAELTTASQRKGHFPIYVTVAGVCKEYWFKNGTADSDLVEKPTDISSFVTAATLTEVRNLLTLHAWGDSLTYGSGAIPQPEESGGVPYVHRLADRIGMRYVAHGQPGASSSIIKANFLASSAEIKAMPTIFWAGTNNSPGDASILTDIAAMVAALGHDRYLVIGLMGHNTSDCYAGTSNYNAYKSTNTALAATYTVRFVDIWPYLVSLYNPALPDDVTAHTNDVVPPSIMPDHTHLADYGYISLADLIVANDQVKYLYGPATKALTLASVGTLLAADGLALRPRVIYLGGYSAAAQPGSVSDGNGQPFYQSLLSKGGATFVHPYPSSGVNAGGVIIKPRFKGYGAWSTMEISGVNPTLWTAGKGLMFDEVYGNIAIGSPITTTSDLSMDGSLLVGQGISVGKGVYFNVTVALGSAYPARGVIDVSSTNGAAGIILPTLTSAQQVARGGGGPDQTGLPEDGELQYNKETGRLIYGIPRTDYPGYRKWKLVATVDDLPNVSNLAVRTGGNTFTGTQTWLHSAPGAGAGGIALKNGSVNVSGYATMEISGTSGVWTSGKGISFNNFSTDIIVGSNLALTGILSVTGSIATTGNMSASALYFNNSIALGSSYPAKGVIDVSTNNGGPGIILATMNTAQQNARGGGGPTGDGNPEHGELQFNGETGQILYGINRTDYPGYRRWKRLLNTDDIPNLSAYATVAGNNNFSGYNQLTGNARGLLLNGLTTTQEGAIAAGGTERELLYNMTTHRLRVRDNTGFRTIAYLEDISASGGFDIHAQTAYAGDEVALEGDLDAGIETAMYFASQTAVRKIDFKTAVLACIPGTDVTFSSAFRNTTDLVDLKGRGSVPTAAPGGLITGTASVTGSDYTGKAVLNITSASTVTAGSALVVVTFGAMFETVPVVQITALSSNAGGYNGSVYIKDLTQYGFTIATTAAGTLSTASGITWSYLVTV